MHLLHFVLLSILLVSNVGGIADPWRTLGVHKSASLKEIKAAYRTLAQKYHPDKNSATSAHNKFLEVQEAYETLTNPEKKQEFENQQRYGSQAAGSHQRSYQGGGGRFHHPNFHFQHGFNFGGFGGHRFFQRIESETPDISSDAFFRHVLRDTRPWLLQVFEDSSAACQAAAREWEAAHHVLRGEGIALGRVRYSREIGFAHLLARSTSSFASGIAAEDLPAVFGVRPSCVDVRCAIRYTGELTSNGLQAFVADKLLALRRVPSIEVDALEGWLESVPLHKVAFVAISDKGAAASFKLRLAAQRHPTVQAARLRWSLSNSRTLRALGVSRAPAVLVYRSFLDPPQVIQEGWGTKIDIDAVFAANTVPDLVPLHGGTASRIGCHYSAGTLDPIQSKASADLPELHVIALARGRPRQLAALRKLRELAAAIAADRRSGAGAALERAHRAGRVRITWADAAAQRAFCAFHLRRAGWRGLSVCSPWPALLWGSLGAAGAVPDYPTIMVITYTHPSSARPRAPSRSVGSSYHVGVYLNVTSGLPSNLLKEPLTASNASPLLAWLKTIWADPTSMLEEVQITKGGPHPPGLAAPLDPVPLIETLHAALSQCGELLYNFTFTIYAATPEDLRPLLPVLGIAIGVMAFQVMFFGPSSASPRHAPPRSPITSSSSHRVPLQKLPPSGLRAQTPDAVFAGKPALDGNESADDAVSAQRWLTCSADALRLLVAERIEALVRERGVRLYGSRNDALTPPGFAVLLAIDLQADTNPDKRGDLGLPDNQRGSKSVAELRGKAESIADSFASSRSQAQMLIGELNNGNEGSDAGSVNGAPRAEPSQEDESGWAGVSSHTLLPSHGLNNAQSDSLDFGNLEYTECDSISSRSKADAGGGGLRSHACNAADDMDESWSHQPLSPELGDHTVPRRVLRVQCSRQTREHASPETPSTPPSAVHQSPDAAETVETSGCSSSTARRPRRVVNAAGASEDVADREEWKASTSSGAAACEAAALQGNAGARHARSQLRQACDVLSRAASRFRAEKNVAFYVLLLDSLPPQQRDCWRGFFAGHDRAGSVAALLIWSAKKRRVCFVPGFDASAAASGSEGSRVSGSLELTIEAVLSGSGRWQLLSDDSPL